MALVASVKKHWNEREKTKTCGRWTLANANIAREWCKRGVSVEIAERVLLLGCVRKCTSNHNNGTAKKITSLRYFDKLLDDPELKTAPASYWPGVELTLRNWVARNGPA